MGDGWRTIAEIVGSGVIALLGSLPLINYRIKKIEENHKDSDVEKQSMSKELNQMKIDVAVMQRDMKSMREDITVMKEMMMRGHRAE